MYESIQIRVNRDPNDTILLLFQPLCTQPRLIYCITSNIKYVIIKEYKQKDDLVNYTESATQSLSVYSVQYTLHHELLSSHLCSCELPLLECHRQLPVQHLPGCTFSCPVCMPPLQINICMPLLPSACCLVRPASGTASEPEPSLQHVH